MDNYEIAINNRIAVKNFDPNKKIAPDLINKILKNTILAPSSHGLQALKILAIENQELKKILYPLGNHQKQFLNCSHLIVLLQKKEIDENYIDEHFFNLAKTRNWPIDAIKNSKESLIKKFVTNPEVKEIDLELSNQVYLTLGWLIAICSMENVDTCPIGGFSKEGFDKELNLKDFKSLVCCALGYRDKDDINSKQQRYRRQFSQMVEFY